MTVCGKPRQDWQDLLGIKSREFTVFSLFICLFLSLNHSYVPSLRSRVGPEMLTHSYIVMSPKHLVFRVRLSGILNRKRLQHQRTQSKVPAAARTWEIDVFVFAGVWFCVCLNVRIGVWLRVCFVLVLGSSWQHLWSFLMFQWCRTDQINLIQLRIAVSKQVTGNKWRFPQMCLVSLSYTLENYHYFSFSFTDAKLHLHFLKEAEKRQPRSSTLLKKEFILSFDSV